MSKNEQIALVPKLRFPEFRGRGGWQEKKLIGLTDKSIKWSFIGGPFGSNLKSSDYVDKGVRVIQLQNIGDGEFINDYKIFTSEEKADELLSNNIYPGDIILSKMGDPVGRACLIPDFHGRYVMCSDGIRFVVDENKHSKYFVFSLINSLPFRSIIEKTATGSTRKRIGLDELKNLPTFVPSNHKEQQKIADCLSSLDNLISAHGKKLEQLKSHKKGLMQKLFPAEGQTTPEYRFPEFMGAEEWSLTAIGEMTRVSAGATPSTEKPEYWGGNIPWMSSGELNLKRVFEVEKTITELGLKESSTKIIPEQSVLIGLAGQGKTRGTAAINYLKLCTNQSIAAIHPNGKKFNSEFLYQKLDSKYHYLRSLSKGEGGRGGLNLQIIRSVELLIPKFAEQQKIADCLSSLDELISAQTQKIDTLKAHKKGLMQQLFPSVEDVSS